MLLKFKQWLHHLLNPHCQECQELYDERLEKETECKSCQNYKYQLELNNRMTRDLVNALIESRIQSPVTDWAAPKEEDSFDAKLPEAVTNFRRPWKIKQRHLEQEARERAKLTRKFQEDNERAKIDPKQSAEIEKLEQELGVVNSTE